MRGGSAAELQNERMRIRFRRSGLRHEERPQKKGMRGKLHNADFAVLIGARDLEPALLELFAILRIQSEVAVKRFHRTRGPIGRCGITPSFYRDFHRFSDQRATQRCNEQTGGIGIGLRMGGVGETHNVARILDHQVLKTPASSHEGNAVFARVPNAFQRAFEASIGAAGTAEQSLKLPKVVRLIGRQPYCSHRLPQSFGSVLDTVVRRNVRGILCPEVADDSDGRGGHAISIEAIRTPVKSFDCMPPVYRIGPGKNAKRIRKQMTA